MEDGFDVVSVWVEGERSVVARVVTALAGCTIVATTRAECCPMKCLDGRAIGRLKGQMNPRDMPFCLVHPQLVGGKVTRRLYESI
jgi:hypothetical protein